ncbi:MAG: hypothetical protein M1820_005565 [Bogoriella megaspora]|nr:MAG: hypothetical protein M1820_005565 [Bogoriella megaspora]
MLEFGMPILSGGKDEYQKESYEWVNPLSLDKISEDRRSSSGCRLLQLPVELLGLLVTHIPRSSLCPFSITCRDACALARSRLFAEIKLDYSLQSEQFLDAICAETTERKRHGYTKLPSIGTCVRKLTVETNPLNVYERHQIHLSIAGTLGYEKTQIRCEEGAAFYYGPYLSAVALALESGLPNLTVLRWHDSVVVPKYIFEAICCSPVQDLAMRRIQVDEDVDLSKSLTKRGIAAKFPLRRLNFDLSWVVTPGFDYSTEGSLTGSSLISLCASTLECLSWSILRKGYGFHVPASMVPLFTTLRELRISEVYFDDPGYYSALIPRLSSDRICVLDVAPDRSVAATRFFESRGEVWSLQSFIWQRPPRPEDVDPLQSGLGGFRFLEANTQISKLQLASATHNIFLNNKLLPLLTNGHYHLKSLSLIWASNDIPLSSLQMLSRLVTLEQLHVSAGFQAGWRHSWLVDHLAVRKSLQPLQQLKILAISRDSYNPGFLEGVLTDEGSQYRVDRYYVNCLSNSSVTQMLAILSPHYYVGHEDSDPEEQGDDTYFHNQSDASEDGHEPQAQDENNDGEDDALQPYESYESDDLTNEEQGDLDENFEVAQSDGEYNDSDNDEETVQEEDGRSAEEKIWEREHADRMLKHARRYFASFPQLEHLYIGQLPIKRGPILDSDRDDCYTWLRKTFGWPYDQD